MTREDSFEWASAGIGAAVMLALVLATLVGLLSAFGVVGRLIVG